MARVQGRGQRPLDPGPRRRGAQRQSLHRHFAQHLAAGSRRLRRGLGQSGRAPGRGFPVPLDVPLLRSTVSTAMRMLDNAIDISSYPSDAARAASLEHRPAALGILGFQDALDWLKTSYASATAAADSPIAAWKSFPMPPSSPPPPWRANAGLIPVTRDQNGATAFCRLIRWPCWPPNAAWRSILPWTQCRIGTRLDLCV